MRNSARRKASRLQERYSSPAPVAQCRRVIRQNLVVSLGSVVVLVLAALAGAIPLTLGVVGHEGSTVVVVLNSLRLLWSDAGGEAGRDG